MAGYVPLLSDIFGQKPDIIPFDKIDFGQSQLKSIMANLKAWPQIQQLGNFFQEYMTDAYNKAIPNFSKLLEMGGATSEEILKAAEPLIRGEIPKDVKDMVMRSGAFQALGKGGDFIHSLQARDLGRTSLDLMQTGDAMARGAASATQLWQSIADKTVMNPAGELITPRDQANLDLQQSLIDREVRQAQENVDKAPSPIAKGLSDLVAYLTASYIGRKPAGKPPDATNYGSDTTVANATDVTGKDFYGMSSFGTQPASVANPDNLATQGIFQTPPSSGSGGIDYSSGSLPPSISQNDLNQVDKPIWETDYSDTLGVNDPSGYAATAGLGGSVSNIRALLELINHSNFNQN